ncbi:MAG: hypothetical protein ACI9XR_001528 [Flavobacterium sp.]|jgi:hypothetical protein
MKKIIHFKRTLMLNVSSKVSSYDLLTEVPILKVSVGFLIQIFLILAIIIVLIIAFFLCKKNE